MASPGPPPLVSIVIPAYNAAGTIGRTIDSVLRQTFADFELLVIDDGSRDGTAACVASVEDPRVQLHTFENRGLPTSRNRGVARARGEFIAFVDADDLWKPLKLERQVAALRAAPEAALAYSLTDSIDEHDRFLAHGTHVVADGMVYEKLLLFNFLDSGSSPLIRTAALRSAGEFDVSVPITADWDMWLRLAHSHPFVCVPEVDVLYRVHCGAMSSNVPALEAQSVAVLRSASERLPVSHERSRLHKAALANVYYYCTSRALRAATSRGDGLRAARFALKFLWNARPGPANWHYGAVQLAKSVLVIVLPARESRRLLDRLAERHR
jgi:glycosyltransferase involved in cell wall biosynthesis